jgi:DNA polymerase-3 subunit alpha
MPDSSAVAPTPFIHLRAHSAYSLSEGALPVKQLAQLALDNDMPALALTDSDNLFGALEFSEVLAGKGIQPIIGTTMRVELGDQSDGPAQR